MRPAPCWPRAAAECHPVSLSSSALMVPASLFLSVTSRGDCGGEELITQWWRRRMKRRGDGERRRSFCSKCVRPWLRGRHEQEEEEEEEHCYRSLEGAPLHPFIPDCLGDLLATPPPHRPRPRPLSSSSFLACFPSSYDVVSVQLKVSLPIVSWPPQCGDGVVGRGWCWWGVGRSLSLPNHLPLPAEWCVAAADVDKFFTSPS